MLLLLVALLISLLRLHAVGHPHYGLQFVTIIEIWNMELGTWNIAKIAFSFLLILSQLHIFLVQAPGCATR
jgi:hypothetical protein